MVRIASIVFVMAAAFALTRAQTPPPTPEWNPRAAASHLDERMSWWLQWPNAARDHDTTCVSCHTVAPYALARPALRATLGERDAVVSERAMLAHVVKRVKLWKEVEPFYPDQLRGLPKTSESRGTEAVMNALVLAARDAEAGALSDDARQAFANLWALQFKAGPLKGAWAWLNFHYEPWEADNSAYYGAALAALAVGTAPAYSVSGDIQDQVKLLRDYLQARVEKESLFNRATVLWASTKLAGLLTEAQRDAIIDAAIGKQQDDGGWSMASLGSWKRVDASAPETAADGYATGLITLALLGGHSPRAHAAAGRGLLWLKQHQDPANGMWRAASLNKQRDPASDAAKFMSDAATAYAVLALAEGRKPPPSR